MPYKDKEKQREAQRKWEKENRGAGKRHKVWMFIFYPDTAEVGWRDECDELGLPFLVSPLHDRDVWTAADERRNPDHIEGEVKVAHHHGLVEYPQPVGYDTVKEDFAFLHTHSIKYAKSKAWVLSVERVGDVGDSALVEPDGDELVSQLGKRRWRVMGDPEDGWWVEVDSAGNELPGDWEYDRNGGYVYCAFA